MHTFSQHISHFLLCYCNRICIFIFIYISILTSFLFLFRFEKRSHIPKNIDSFKTQHKNFIQCNCCDRTSAAFEIICMRTNYLKYVNCKFWAATNMAQNEDEQNFRMRSRNKWNERNQWKVHAKSKKRNQNEYCGIFFMQSGENLSILTTK